MLKTKYISDMASVECFEPKPTMPIYGEEGRRFIESAKHPKKLSKRELERMRKAYELFKAVFKG